MPYDRPTLQTLIDRAIADVEANLPGADARLRRTFEKVIAIVQGGLSHGNHGHLDYIARQIFPDSSDTEELDRHAGIWEVSDGQGGVGRKQPIAASGSVDVNATGVAVLPDQYALTRADGVRFLVQGAVNFTGLQTASVPVLAEDPGEAGNTDTGTTLDLSAPIANINTETTVIAPGLTRGDDLESGESLIVRILQKIRQGGNAGGPGFYDEIATAQAGVTRSKELPQQLGPGTVQIVIIDDTVPDKIPSATVVSNTQAAIDALAPVIAIPTVTAVLSTGVAVTADLTIATGFSFDDVKATVEASIKEYFDTLGPGDVAYVTAIANAIQDVEGVENHAMTAPAADTTPATVTTVPLAGLLTIGES